MNTYPNRSHSYGDWRDMTVDEVRAWLRLRVRSWWRHVTLMDLYDDDNQTKGLPHSLRGRSADAAGVLESPRALPRRALGRAA